MREDILKATMIVFGKKGLKFTMDDLARELSASKKTIYLYFKDKESLLYEMVDYMFDGIKECENDVLNDAHMTTMEKIRKILGVMPEGYKSLDFRHLYELKEKHPKIYDKVEKRLETGWESTIMLLEKAKSEGAIRDISIPLFKVMFEASLEQFFKRDVLIRNNISYNDAVQEVVDILIDGITI